MKLRVQLHLLVVTAIVIPTLLLLPSRSDALLCCDDDPIPTPAAPRLDRGDEAPRARRGIVHQASQKERTFELRFKLDV